jgi:hypothetical protein
LHHEGDLTTIDDMTVDVDAPTGMEVDFLDDSMIEETVEVVEIETGGDNK